MEFRKLQKEEHFKTRQMWEEIFTEDSASFLDYYYDVKTADNDIFVAEEEGTIRSMLQLNPYQLHLGDKIIESHYIIAVATDVKYRHRGLMAALLKMSMKQMYADGEPFTFLMPAAEAIYRPFDFRYIYAQRQSSITAEQVEDFDNIKAGLSFEDAGCGDAEELAAFAEKYLKTKYAVYAVRDRHYYDVVRKEQISENGGIRILRYNHKIAGYFFYDIGEEYSVREPLILPEFEDEFKREVLRMAQGRKVACFAYGEEREKPLIMARIICLQKFMEMQKTKEDLDFSVSVEDHLLDENCGCFHLSGLAGGRIHVERCQEEECAQAQIPIALLTEILFGYVKPLQLSGCIPGELLKELCKIEPASPVFLNEIV